MATQVLSDDQIRLFKRDGFLCLRGFYDRERELLPIQRGIHGIIGLVIQKYGLPIEQAPFRGEAFDSGFQELIAIDRGHGGEVYDAIKQIPAFVRLVASEKNERILRELRATDAPGVAAGSFGIRIDNPGEEKFRANWHQDYPANFRSLDGVVFWAPLTPITEEMGPVRFCVGSHKDGLRRCHSRDPEHPEKTGAYALRLENEQSVVDSYPQAAPLTDPGDLVIIDYLTIHSSGFNRARRSRWTMQSRYFNFDEPTGIRLGWKGGFGVGAQLRDIHPELLID